MSRKIIYREGDIVRNCVFIKEIDSIINKNNYKSRVAIFKCECGNEFTAMIYNIRKRNTNSCGCILKNMLKDRNKSNIIHGLSRTSEYRTWNGLLNRCLNKNNPSFSDYGGRGIDICNEWIDRKTGFIKFLADMGAKPGKDYSLERINNNEGYNKSNCKWALPAEQNSNKRSNVMIEYRGKNQCLSFWAKEFNTSPVMIKFRIKRLGIENAFSYYKTV